MKKQSYKKGERVSFFSKSVNENVHGTVVKGGATRLKIILDGAEQQVTGHPLCFEVNE